MKDEKLLIFKIICFAMFPLGLIISAISFNFAAGVIFTFILVIILIMSKKTSTGIKYILAWNKAKKKGKKYCGYVYQIIERNKNDDNIVDHILVQDYNTIDLNKLDRLIRKLSGILVLKFILYDDAAMETILIEHEITIGLKAMYEIDKQYYYVYKYKDEYYVMPSDVVPKFVIPKNLRLEIKQKLDKIINYEVGK